MLSYNANSIKYTLCIVYCHIGIISTSTIVTSTSPVITVTGSPTSKIIQIHYCQFTLH